MVALLGHPVGHSMSPALHNAAFSAAGVDAVYVAFDVAPADLDAAVAAVRALGLLGANVTVPHKRGVFERIPRRTSAAEASGAANTVYWDDGTLAVDNTDISGLEEVLRRDVGLAGGEAVVVFGAGGAARAAAVAVGTLGCRLEVVARRDAAAAAIRDVGAATGAEPASVPHPDVVINATPLGLRGEALPERFMALRPDQTALDLIYASHDTPFLAAARGAGARALDGRGLLVAQAAASFERWTGRPAPRDVMARAVQRGLAARR